MDLPFDTVGAVEISMVSCRVYTFVLNLLLKEVTSVWYFESFIMPTFRITIVPILI